MVPGLRVVWPEIYRAAGVSNGVNLHSKSNEDHQIQYVGLY